MDNNPKLKIPMSDSQIREIQKINIKALREVLTRNLGDVDGMFLTDCIIGKRGKEIEQS